MDVVESKWYEMDMPLNDVKKLLSANIKTMSRSFIAAGYYMKYIRDRELFRDGGYNSIWEFAEDQYGIKKSAASRWMAMNDKFSKDGNSPILDDKYKDFNKSQLQEMLYLTDEQMEEAEPEMSAKEIRAIRKPPEVEVIAPAQQIDDQIPGQDSIEQHPEYMPGKMTIETATGQNRPPQNEIPITPELQIERFFEALNRGDKERVLTCDTKAATYLLEARYQDVRIRNGNFNYQANSTGIMFNPGSYMECAFIKSPRRLSQQAINSLKEAWRNLYSNNTESVVILNEGLDFQEASNTSVEMQLNENKKTNGDEICKVIGIPPSLLSGNAGEQDEKNFIKYELSNLLAEFRTALNRAMLLESEKQMYFFDFDISELIKGDIDKRYNAYSVGIEKGFLQTDEVRKKENMPPLGMKFIKLGLQDGLYDPESNKVIVLNTSKTLDLTKIKEGGDDSGE